ncbi:MAG: TonB-dependent receptor [Verrucomicrobia bacterium]|nr:TonB-dependent receptor [Verrucomicrobiota bacterium]
MTTTLRRLAAAVPAFGALVALSVTPRVAAQTSPPAAPAKLDAYEVTGSRIKRTDLEGPSPVFVITREDLDLVAATGLADVLRDLPEAANLGINEGVANTGTRTANAINLRNLGPGNTLILVDGRRQAPNGIDAGGTVFVDPNRIPAAMIERVEFLKDGASAIYGSDATAGVINIITRRQFSGAELSARYGNTLKHDAAEQAYSFLGGVTRGRLRANVALTYSSRHANAATDQPFSSDADLTARYRAQDPAKYASLTAPVSTFASNVDFRSTSGPYAVVTVPTAAQLAAAGLTTAAIRNPLTGQTSTFLPGTGGVPQGTFGSTATPASAPRTNNPGRPAAAQFVPVSYASGTNSNNFNFLPFQWNSPEIRRRGLSLNLEFTLTPDVALFANLFAGRNNSETRLAPSPVSTGVDFLLVPATNYYNPFGIPLAFNFRPVDAGPRLGLIRTTSLGYLVGAKGAWRKRFDWDVALSSSTNEVRDVSANMISRSKLRAALARTTPDAFNIFGGPNFKNDPATLASIRIDPVIVGDTRTTHLDSHVSTADLFQLPWGRVGASAGLEHRKEIFNATNDPLFSNAFDIVSLFAPSVEATRSHREVDSVAAELRLPLVSEGRFRLAHTLELSGAARFEKFSDGYDSGVKPFVGLRYRPARSLLIRASYGHTFRAPTLPQLYTAPIDGPVTGQPDLRRPDALTGDPVDSTTFNRIVRSGGNPRLLPEDARTKQIGAVFDVPWSKLKGLSFDFTHGVIHQLRLITGGLGATAIRQNELGDTGDLVIREPGTQTFTNTTNTAISILSGPANQRSLIQPGQSATVPGRIIYILDAATNLADQIVRYYDYGLRYDFRFERAGRFTLRSNWTYYGYYASRRFTNAAYVDRTGRTLPRYRGQSTLTWQRGSWGGNLGMNYTHRYADITRELYEVERYYTFSVGASYAFRRHKLLGDTQLAVGVENLLDQDPPLAQTTTGYNPGWVGRPGGRFVFVSLRRSL